MTRTCTMNADGIHLCNACCEALEREHNYPTAVPTKLRVQVEQSAFGSLYTDKPTMIEAGFKRFVKLPELPEPCCDGSHGDDCPCTCHNYKGGNL